jgi:outer membrane scaffolding protein for murein synthesis (MipA/OmpV family)
MRLVKFLLSVCAAVTMFGTAAAQQFESSASWLQGFDDWLSELTDVRAEDVQWSVGAGLGTTPDFPGSGKYDTVALPLFQVRVRDQLSIDPLGVRFRVLRTECCRLRLFAGLSDNRSADAAHPVSRLPDVDRGLNLGLVFEGRIAGPVAFRLNARREVAGGHGGFTLAPALGVIVRDSAETYSMIPELAVTWADGRYMESFFGVTPAGAAASGLAPFDAGAGFRDLALRITTTYRLDEHWTMIGRLQAARLLGSARRSSIVRQAGEANQGLIGFGFLYSF